MPTQIGENRAKKMLKASELVLCMGVNQLRTPNIAMIAAACGFDATGIASLPGTFVLKRGTPKIYIKTAESGTKRAHGFCPECGTPLYSTSPEANPQSYGLRVGGIDQRAEFGPPARQIWCRSALPWSMNISGVERAERG